MSGVQGRVRWRGMGSGGLEEIGDGGASGWKEVVLHVPHTVKASHGIFTAMCCVVHTLGHAPIVSSS